MPPRYSCTHGSIVERMHAAWACASAASSRRRHAPAGERRPATLVSTPPALPARGTEAAPHEAQGPDLSLPPTMRSSSDDHDRGVMGAYIRTCSQPQLLAGMHVLHEELAHPQL